MSHCILFVRRLMGKVFQNMLLHQHQRFVYSKCWIKRHWSCHFHNYVAAGKVATAALVTSVFPSFSEGGDPLPPRCFWSGCSLVCSQDPTYPSERPPGEEQTPTQKYISLAIKKLLWNLPRLYKPDAFYNMLGKFLLLWKGTKYDVVNQVRKIW